MSKQQEASEAIVDDVEQIVVDYLQAHPDFFKHHLDLLGDLYIPHPCKPAISLIERQLLLLREQNTQLRKKLIDLVAVARDNDSLSRRMHNLTLGLLEAHNLDDLLQRVEDVLRDEFNADFTGLQLAARPVEALLDNQEVFVSAQDLVQFESMLRTGRPLCGRLTSEQLRSLFTDTAPRIGSVALIPLRGIDWQGLLAVGSEDDQRFHPGMSTLFLSRMGDQLSRCLQPYLRGETG